MAPSFEILKGMAGNKFRLKPEILPPGSKSPREIFMATKAPIPGQSGLVVLSGQLSGNELTIGTSEDLLLEKVS